jgi:hypothetical protein
MTSAPEVTALARQDAKSYDELKAKYTDWLWKICQRNDDDAEHARVALHDAIDAHHASARDCRPFRAARDARDRAAPALGRRAPGDR